MKIGSFLICMCSFYRCDVETPPENVPAALGCCMVLQVGVAHDAGVHHGGGVPAFPQGPDN